MFDVSYPIAFVSGIISFFAPCAVSLLPAYIGYIIGVSAHELQASTNKYSSKIILSSLAYILGFSLIFVALGTAAAGLGQILRTYDDIIRVVGGILIFLLGLNFAGYLKLPAFAAERKFPLPSWAGKLGYGRSFLIGVVFATAWTPCVGAVLGAILSLAAISQTVINGATLLFIYSLGISIPFLIVALTIAQAPRYLSFISAHIGSISKISGLILAILGVLLFTDTYKYFNAWLFDVAYGFGYQIR